MCELFALSSDAPATVTVSLGVFSERGGRLGPQTTRQRQQAQQQQEQEYNAGRKGHFQ